MDNLYTNFVPWEWWIGYDGKVYMGQERGSDKSVSMKIVHAERLNEVDAQRSVKKSAQRIRVTGSGEGREQDNVTSDWQNDTSAMDVINGFYEIIEGDKEISKKEMADILAKVLLTQLKDPREELNINDVDLLPFTANDYDMGDYVTATDSWTQLSDAYRIKTIEKTIDSLGGEITNITLSKKRTDISDRLASLQKELNKIFTSNTTLSKILNNQNKIDPTKLEDVWEITAKNKYAFELPEESSTGADAENMVFTVSAGSADYSCSKDEFYVALTSNLQDEAYLYNTSLDLNWEQNPRFTCELEIDTDVGGVWAEGDIVRVGIFNTNCSLGFGFQIQFLSGAFDIRIVLFTTEGGTPAIKILPLGGITYNVKYKLEAEIDWENKIARFSFGSPTHEFKTIGVHCIPQNEAESGQLLHPVMVYMLDTAAANDKYVYIYNWRTQAKALYTP
jgi:hypothetical protein